MRYIRRIQSTGRRYVRLIDDLTRRLCEHNSIIHNARKLTARNLGSWIVIHCEERATRIIAMQKKMQADSLPAPTADNVDLAS